MTTSDQEMTEAEINAERLARALDLYFADQGQGFNSYLMAQEWQAELAQMNALSDLDLLAEGLTRRDVPDRVFHKLMARRLR